MAEAFILNIFLNALLELDSCVAEWLLQNNVTRRHKAWCFGKIATCYTDAVCVYGMFGHCNEHATNCPAGSTC